MVRLTRRWGRLLRSLFAIAVLGCAVGTTLAVLLVADRMIGRPYWLEEPDRVVHLGGLAEQIVNAVDWWGSAEAIESLAQWMELELPSRELDGKPMRVAAVSPGFHALLGARPLRGQLFSDDDPDDPAAKHAVVGEAFWESRYGKSASILGETVDLGGEGYTITGILPKRFEFPFGTQAWILRSSFPAAQRGSVRWIGRLAPGHTLKTAHAQLTVLLDRLNRDYSPKTGMRYGDFVNVRSIGKAMSNEAGPAFLFLAGASLLFLMVAGINCSAMLFSLAVQRGLEFGVRICVGATGSRLIGMLAAEAAALSIATGLIALTVSYWSLALASAVLGARVGQAAAFDLPAGLFVFGAGVALSGILAALAMIPAARWAFRANPADLLREGSANLSGGPGRLTRGLILTVELAAAYSLVLGGAIAYRSYTNLATASLGFEPSTIAAVGVTLDQPGEGRFLAVAPNVATEIQRAVPSTTVAFALSVPLLDGSGSRSFHRDGEYFMARTFAVSRDFFDVMSIPFRQRLPGSEFDGHVAIVNEDLARLLFGGEPAIGSVISVDGETLPRTIIGVTGSIRTELPGEARPGVQVFLPIFHGRWSRSIETFTIMARSGQPGALARQLRQAVASTPGVRGAHVRSFDTALHTAVEPARMRTALLAFFAGIAVLLTLAGAYGLVALAARMRTREMGVRMVMGATPRRVLGHLTGEVVVVSVIGAIIGGLVANAAANVLRSLLFGISASDWVLGSAAAVLFFCATLAAAVIPAWKISRMQPRDALDRSG